MGEAVIVAVLYSVTSLSLLSTFVVFTSYLTFPDLRTPIYQAVTYLALSDFIWELFVIVCQLDSSSTNCQIYSYLITSFQVASVCWTVYIAYCVKNSIINQTEFLPRFKWWVYPLLGYGLPMAFASLPFVTDSYDKEVLMWCLMARHDSLWANLWYSILFYLPLVVGLVYCLVSYIKTSRVVRLNRSIVLQDAAELKSRLFFIRKLKYFPMILVVCWVPGLVLDFTLYLAGAELEDVDKAAVILSCAQGLLNSLAYGYSSVLWTYLRSRFCPRLGGVMTKEDIVDELLGF
jgi:hypothetical protein